MIFHLKWYLENPSKHYNKALNSSNPLDNVLAIIDKQTGSRCIDDWKNESNQLIKICYLLRKKYKKYKK